MSWNNNKKHRSFALFVNQQHSSSYEDMRSRIGLLIFIYLNDIIGRYINTCDTMGTYPNVICLKYINESHWDPHRLLYITISHSLDSLILSSSTLNYEKSAEQNDIWMWCIKNFVSAKAYVKLTSHESRDIFYSVTLWQHLVVNLRIGHQFKSRLSGNPVSIPSVIVSWVPRKADERWYCRCHMYASFDTHSTEYWLSSIHCTTM